MIAAMGLGDGVVGNIGDEDATDRSTHGQRNAERPETRPKATGPAARSSLTELVTDLRARKREQRPRNRESWMEQVEGSPQPRLASRFRTLSVRRA
jgi:hypothetical protein